MWSHGVPQLGDNVYQEVRGGHTCRRQEAVPCNEARYRMCSPARYSLWRTILMCQTRKIKLSVFPQNW